MLRPLNPLLLEALSREGDSDEGLDFDTYHHISSIKRHIMEGEDLALGVWRLVSEGGDFI